MGRDRETESMGQPQSRKSGRTATRPNKRIHRADIKTKHHRRDVDQIHGDMDPEAYNRLVNQAEDVDLPGLGQFYCVESARHFATAKDLAAHKKSKVYKRALKNLKEPKYTQAEAEAAAGLGSGSSTTKHGRPASALEQLRQMRDSKN